MVLKSRSSLTPYGVLLLIVICVAWGLFLIIPSTKSTIHDIDMLQLDFTPMTNPSSTLVVLHKNGAARSVHYHRYQFAVSSVHTGLIPEDLRRLFFDSQRQLVMQEECWGKSFAGAGLSRGNQFSLMFSTKEETVSGCFGFVSDASTPVNAFVEEVLRIETTLEPGPLDDAYIRSTPIEKARLNSLQQTGTVHFDRLSDFHEAERASLSDAMAKPQDFRPISRRQYDELLGKTGGSHELFLIEDGHGYQISLFEKAGISGGDKQ